MGLDHAVRRRRHNGRWFLTIFLILLILMALSRVSVESRHPIMGALFSFIVTALLLAVFLAFSFSAEASLSAGDNPSISGTGSGTVQNNPGYFLRASHEGSEYRFGVFGYTGTRKIGYRFPVSYVL